MSEATAGNRNMWIIAAAVLALGVIVGGYLMGDGIRRARMADRAVTVRGLAERNVTADLATWTLTFTAQGNELSAVQAEFCLQARDDRTDDLDLEGIQHPADPQGERDGRMDPAPGTVVESGVHAVNLLGSGGVTGSPNDARRVCRCRDVPVTSG